MDQQWEPVVLSKRGRRSGESKSAEINRAKRVGGVASQHKFGAGTNKSAHHGGGGADLRKVEAEEESFTHSRVDRSLAQAIQKARMEKEMTQKQLAQAIAEKPQVVNQYESGKAIPNPAILSKLERALGTRLPRPPKKSKK
mmetsp:Transcript_18329/g.58450  ORF Transcript_18329/g.58450 Transcript_18329/m.58450 type:complete len:141 (+) Transcript_18329:81-503(+)